MNLRLRASFASPEQPRAVVIVAHCGTDALERARIVGDMLHASGVASLLVDLLTADEDHAPRGAEHPIHDPPRLAQRLDPAFGFVHSDPRTSGLPVGVVADGIGCAALLVAAAARSSDVEAIACLGGRPSAAGAAIGAIRAPTLLIAGADAADELASARRALGSLRFGELAVIEDTTDLLDDAGALHAALLRARRWFDDHLGPVHH